MFIENNVSQMGVKRFISSDKQVYYLQNCLFLGMHLVGVSLGTTSVLHHLLGTLIGDFTEE